MSKATEQALEAAMAAHLADVQDGAILTGYVLQIRGQGFAEGDEDRVRMTNVVPDDQDFITTLGLIEWLHVQAHSAALSNND